MYGKVGQPHDNFELISNLCHITADKFMAICYNFVIGNIVVNLVVSFPNPFRCRWRLSVID